VTSLEQGAAAAVDCGTNSTRLLVVDDAGGTLDRLMRITRLGEGVDATGKLSAEAIDRTLEVLAEYRTVTDGRGVSRVRLVATSAVRDAVNGPDFTLAAAEVVGVPVEVLTGQEEGRLAYAGAVSGLGPGVGHDAVVDIGGGSTELVVGGPGGVRAVSLDIGCVRVSERYLQPDPPGAIALATAREAVRARLDEAVVELPALAALPPGGRLIGLAGTVSTLTSLELGLAEYDRAKLHGATLSEAAVE
jgi:exopolyphosphatase / guanosine-5'-triphosphate,3'-diphosphate pyrophosphatase